MIPTKHVWAGRIVSALTVVFLLIDAVTKIVRAQIAVDGTVQLGYPEGEVTGIGFLLLGCIVLYVIPLTSFIGAILLTGYLGGAVATHVRVGSPLLGYILFPVYIGVMVWGGLWLRDPRLRSLISSGK